MEYLKLFHLGRLTTENILREASAAHGKGGWRLSTFNDLPTAMLFSPNQEHEGSLHYMYFPSQAAQKFHYHPGARYLLLIGNVDVYVDYSMANAEQNPHASAQRIKIPRFVFTAIRFKPYLWHKFETRGAPGEGVVAFSFHGNDHLDQLSIVSDNLMEEVTVFWPE